MTNLFEPLTQLAVDPFELQAYLAGLPGKVGAGLPTLEVLRQLAAGSDPRNVAGGDWSACPACSDPGGHPIPDDYGPPPENDASTRD